MRHEERLLKTMSALRECLDECRRAPAPLAVLDRYVDYLRLDPEWEDEEVRNLESVARRAIQARGDGRLV